LANDTIWLIALNFILYAQASEWDVDSSSKGLYESIIFVSMLIGSYFWSYIADHYGRLKPFKTQILVLFVGAVGMTFSFNIGMFVVFAFVTEFTIGGELIVGGAYYKEFIPASKSSSISILTLALNVGLLLSALLAMAACDFELAGLEGWRWMCIVLLILEVGFILLRLQVRETPFFLASRGRFEEADEVLNAVSPRQISITNTGFPMKESLVASTESFMRDDPQTSREGKPKTSNKNQFLNLFKGDLLRPTLVFGAVRTTQYCFLGNIPILGMTLFMPEIIAHVDPSAQSCFMSFLIYSIQQCAGIPANVIVYRLLDTWLGRRWSLVIFTSLAGVFMFSFLLVSDLAGVFHSQFIVVSSLCIAVCYMAGAAFGTMLSETYPTEIRSTGASWMLMCLKIGSVVCPFITGNIIASYGVSTVIILYASLMTACGMIGLATRETRGRKTF
jgi:putative MFS transporter